VVTGRVKGCLARVPRGSGGFGHDPIFLPDGFERTIAEMTAEAKDASATMAAPCALTPHHRHIPAVALASARSRARLPGAAMVACCHYGTPDSRDEIRQQGTNHCPKTSEVKISTSVCVY
jgi:Ham1 family